jgi:hypothetical protein
MGPRAARIGRLAAEMAAAYAEGDVEGARAVNEAIGKILAAPAPVGAQTSTGAPVVDLARERERRGR